MNRRQQSARGILEDAASASTRWATSALVFLSAALCVVAGCGAEMGGAGDWYDVERPVAYEAGDLDAAEYSLKRHDVQGAYKQYEVVLEQDDALTRGTAAAGKGVMGALLLPDSSGARDLIIRGLKANYSGYSTQRLVWGREGLIDLFHQGSPWEDDGIFVGARSLLVDELPWSAMRLGSVANFVGPLNEAFGTLSPHLVELAQSILEVEQDLQIAIQDPKFEYLYLPASLFHDEALAFVVGKSDLATLHGALSIARGGLYFVAAYANRWSLAGVFGEVDETGEIAYERLDGQLLREIAEDGYLLESRRAFQEGLDMLAHAITLGLEQGESSYSELSVLRWDRVDRDEVRKLRDVLESLSYALDEPTKMPHFTQDFTLDLSSFFEAGGRTLSPEMSWFEYDAQTATFTGLSNAAYHEFFERGLYSPPASPGEPYPAELTVNGTVIEEMREALWGQTRSRIEQAFPGF